MYDNMRSELGADFEEVERAIQTLRSLDPRRELDASGRKFIAELARDVGPEAESLLKSSPSQMKDSVAKSLLAGQSSTKSAEIPAPLVGADYSRSQLGDRAADAGRGRTNVGQPQPVSEPTNTITLAAPKAPTVSPSELTIVPAPDPASPPINGIHHDAPTETIELDSKLEEPSASSQNGHGSYLMQTTYTNPAPLDPGRRRSCHGLDHARSCVTVCSAGISPLLLEHCWLFRILTWDDQFILSALIRAFHG